MSQDDKKSIGRILLEQRALSQADLDRALADQRPGGVPLATRLTQQGLISELDALKALSTQRGVPGIDLSQINIKLTDLNVIPREIALRHRLLPVLEREDRIFVAMANPEDKKALEELEFVTGKRIFAYIALEGTLVRAIRDAYDMRERGHTHYIGESARAAGGGTTQQSVAGALPAPPGAARVPAPAIAAPAAKAPATPPVAPAPPRPAPPAPAPPATAPEEVDPFADLAREMSEPPAPAPAPRPPAAKAPEPLVRPNAPQPGIPGPKVPGLEVGRAGDARREPERRFRPTPLGTPAQRATPVIVDDQLRKHVESQVSDADFGDLDRELSVVTGLAMHTEDRREGAKTTGKKILIVDDEADIRKMLRRVLEELGYRVVEADRGKLALQMVKLEAPDMLILDAMLPEIHGFDIARRIRGSTRYGQMPIVMISAVYRGWRIAEDLKQSYGVDAYIEKPFKVADVVAAVQHALDSKPQKIDPERINAEAERLLNDGVDAYKAGNIDKATELLESGVRLDPLAYRLRFHLGLLYGKRGQIYDAIEQLERALEIQSRHFASVKNLAILYQQAGFRNKAVEAWERALQLAADEPTKQTIREHLLSLL